MPGADPTCRSGGTDGIRRPGAASSPCPASFRPAGGKGMKHLFKTDAAMLACLMLQGAVQPAFADERTPKRLWKRRHGRKPAMRLCVQSGRAALPGPGRQAGHQAGRRAGRRRGPPLVREGLRAGGEATAQFSLSAMNAESRGVRRTARARRPAGRHPGSMPPRTGAGGSRLLAGFSPAQAGCTAPDAHGMKGVLAWQTTQSNRHPGSQPASPRRKAGSADICADICVPAP